MTKVVEVTKVGATPVFESEVSQGLFYFFHSSMAVPGSSCGVRLFADDCVLYCPVSSQADCEPLQSDLSNLEAWERKWCMSINLDKLTFSRKANKIIHN